VVVCIVVQFADVLETAIMDNLSALPQLSSQPSSHGIVLNSLINSIIYHRRTPRRGETGTEGADRPGRQSGGGDKSRGDKGVCRHLTIFGDGKIVVRIGRRAPRTPLGRHATKDGR